MTLEPAVVVGFVGIKVIEDDVDGGVGMGGDDIIHEVEELDAPPALLVRGRHLAGGYFEGGEQRRGTVALVIVAMSGQRSTVRKLGYPCARSSAWIEGFSSTQMTIAFSGGAM